MTCYTSKDQAQADKLLSDKIQFITNTQQNREIETPSEVTVLSEHFRCKRNQSFCLVVQFYVGIAWTEGLWAQVNAR